MKKRGKSVPEEDVKSYTKPKGYDKPQHIQK